MGGLGASNIAVINLTSNSIVDIGGVSSTFGMAITPNGKLAYVADEGSNSLSIINLSSNSIIKTLSGFGFPYSVAITPNGKLAYVVNYESDSVSVINVSSNSVINSIAVGSEPTGAGLSGLDSI